MPTYKAKFGDKIISVVAESPEKAALMARLKFAGQTGVDQATAGAEERQGMRPTADPTADAPYPRLEPVRPSHFNPATPEGLINLGLGGASMAAAAPGAALGLAKDTAIYGAAEGAEKLLGLPSWTGEAIGAINPVKSLGKLLLGGAIGGAKKGAVTAAAKTVAPEAIRKAELDIAIKEARLAKMAKDAARAEELHQARLAKVAGSAPKPGPRAVPKPAPRTEGATALKPEPEMIPDEAVSLVAEPLPFKPRALPDGQRAMATNLGGKAKPGPAPTPPDKLEETLRASVEAGKKITPAKVEKALTEAAKELNDEGLRVPRIQVGAQRVGRDVGMTKEQVRQASGPILNEARGEASPIFPRQALESIVDKIKSIPMAERDAYVRAATSEKAMWQVETIRRTLEKLGLLIPAGVAVGSIGTE